MVEVSSHHEDMHKVASSPFVVTSKSNQISDIVEAAFTNMARLDAAGLGGIEKTSMYGCALAVPQVARSASWSRTLVMLVIRTFFFYVLNLVVQFFLIYMVYVEFYVMNTYAGQMHLCDFGAHMEDCPHGPNCQGPGGTAVAPERIYAFGQWSTRTFVRDSLKAIFPEQAQDIDAKVDPGEYGMENFYCRFVCLFIMILPVTSELTKCFEIARLLYHLPRTADSWVEYENASKSKEQVGGSPMAQPTSYAAAREAGAAQSEGYEFLPVVDTTPQNSERGLSPREAKEWHDEQLKRISFKVSGMPMQWKLFNVVFILVPKLALWYAAAYSCFYCLMETASIINLIVNTTSMVFLLNVDEMFFEHLMDKMTTHIMGNLDDITVFDVAEEDTNTARTFWKSPEVWWLHNFGTMSVVLPSRFILAILVILAFACTYYNANCFTEEDGSRVSKDLHLPASPTLNPLCIFIKCHEEGQTDVYWSMS